MRRVEFFTALLCCQVDRPCLQRRSCYPFGVSYPDTTFLSPLLSNSTEGFACPVFSISCGRQCAWDFAFALPGFAGCEDHIPISAAGLGSQESQEAQPAREKKSGGNCAGGKQEEKQEIKWGKLHMCRDSEGFGAQKVWQENVCHWFSMVNNRECWCY
jgi:hypothetical protein